MATACGWAAAHRASHAVAAGGSLIEDDVGEVHARVAEAGLPGTVAAVCEKQVAPEEWAAGGVGAFVGLFGSLVARNPANAAFVVN